MPIITTLRIVQLAVGLDIPSSLKRRSPHTQIDTINHPLIRLIFQLETQRCAVQT